jgi:hypothetical protein
MRNATTISRRFLSPHCAEILLVLDGNKVAALYHQHNATNTIPYYSSRIRLPTTKEKMATLSKDFLDSLPADKRDELHNEVFSTLSLSKSKHDDIMEQNIRQLYELYADHKGKGKCVKCDFCRKDEPDNQENSMITLCWNSIVTG